MSFRGEDMNPQPSRIGLYNPWTGRGEEQTPQVEQRDSEDEEISVWSLSSVRRTSPPTWTPSPPTWSPPPSMRLLLPVWDQSLAGSLSPPALSPPPPMGVLLPVWDHSLAGSLSPPALSPPSPMGVLLPASDQSLAGSPSPPALSPPPPMRGPSGQPQTPQVTYNYSDSEDEEIVAILQQDVQYGGHEYEVNVSSFFPTSRNPSPPALSPPPPMRVLLPVSDQSLAGSPSPPALSPPPPMRGPSGQPQTPQVTYNYSEQSDSEDEEIVAILQQDVQYGGDEYEVNVPSFFTTSSRSSPSRSPSPPASSPSPPALSPPPPMRVLLPVWDQSLAGNPSPPALSPPPPMRVLLPVWDQSLAGNPSPPALSPPPPMRGPSGQPQTPQVTYNYSEQSDSEDEEIVAILQQDVQYGGDEDEVNVSSFFPTSRSPSPPALSPSPPMRDPSSLRTPVQIVLPTPSYAIPHLPVVLMHNSRPFNPVALAFHLWCHSLAGRDEEEDNQVVPSAYPVLDHGKRLRDEDEGEDEEFFPSSRRQRVEPGWEMQAPLVIS